MKQLWLLPHKTLAYYMQQFQLLPNELIFSYKSFKCYMHLVGGAGAVGSTKYLCLHKRGSGKYCIQPRCYPTLAIQNFQRRQENADANRLFSIFARKMVFEVCKVVTCLNKMVFLNYFLLLCNKFQQQIKLIAQYLYSLIRNNTYQSLCNTFNPCLNCHLQKETKRRKVIAQKEQNTLNRTHSSNSYLFNVDVQNRGKGSKSECTQVC